MPSWIYRTPPGAELPPGRKNNQLTFTLSFIHGQWKGQPFFPQDFYERYYSALMQGSLWAENKDMLRPVTKSILSSRLCHLFEQGHLQRSAPYQPYEWHFAPGIDRALGNEPTAPVEPVSTEPPEGFRELTPEEYMALAAKRNAKAPE